MRWAEPKTWEELKGVCQSGAKVEVCGERVIMMTGCWYYYNGPLKTVTNNEGRLLSNWRY